MHRITLFIVVRPYYRSILNSIIVPCFPSYSDTISFMAKNRCWHLSLPVRQNHALRRYIAVTSHCIFWYDYSVFQAIIVAQRLLLGMDAMRRRDVDCFPVIEVSINGKCYSCDCPLQSHLFVYRNSVTDKENNYITLNYPRIASAKAIVHVTR